MPWRSDTVPIQISEKKTGTWIQVCRIPQPTCPHQGSLEAYPASTLAREGIHQGLHPIVHQHGGVEQELLVAVVLGAHLEGVRHERVPVVEMVELHGNAVLVLELDAEQQLRVELELQEVAAQLLHVLLDHDLDGLPWEQGQQSTPCRHGLGSRPVHGKGLALRFFTAVTVLFYLATSMCLWGEGCENGTSCLRLD